jgi:hypothetical protein
MTDLEWASAFVCGKFPGTGVRFNETVDVLVKKLAQVREEAASGFQASGTTSGRRDSPRPLQKQGTSRWHAGIEG